MLMSGSLPLSGAPTWMKLPLAFSSPRYPVRGICELETVDTMRSRLRAFLVSQSLSSSVAMYSSAPNARTSSFLVAFLEIPTTLSAPIALANKTPKWPKPPTPTMPTVFPGPQPLTLRGVYMVMPPHIIGAACSLGRPSDLDGEVGVGSVVVCIAAHGLAFTIGESRVVRVGLLAGAIVFQSRRAVGTVRLETGPRLGPHADAVAYGDMLDVGAHPYSLANNLVADTAGVGGLAPSG